MLRVPSFPPMRAALALVPLLALAACNEDVPDGADFGSGGSGVPTSGSGAGVGASDVTDSSAGGVDSGGADGSGGTVSETEGTGGASAAAEATSASTDPSGDTDGSGEGGSSSGTDASDEGSSTGDGGKPVGDDACGFPLDGPWIEIEYNQAGGTATSPSWSYSDTPGWGEAEWAASNASWPEVWDIFQNINVSNDPIGVVAVVGSSGRLQLMLGFEELVGYDYATVCVEGRSVSTSSSVQFDAYNPLTGIGNSATMAHDWSMHATGLDLGYAFEPGGGVQAVRLDTTGGSSSLGVKRMRLILHGAVY